MFTPKPDLDLLAANICSNCLNYKEFTAGTGHCADFERPVMVKIDEEICWHERVAKINDAYLAYIDKAKSNQLKKNNIIWDNTRHDTFYVVRKEIYANKKEE